MSIYVIDPVRKNKPQIVLINGYWRVSTAPKHTSMFFKRWTDAHIVIGAWNDRRMRGM